MGLMSLGEAWAPAVREQSQTDEKVGDLRDRLAADLRAEGADETTIQEELDIFIENGRFSANNLARLKRRVRARAQMRVADGAGSSDWKFSASPGLPRLPQSARSHSLASARVPEASDTSSVLGAALQPMSSRLRQAPAAQAASDQPITQWSEVFKHEIKKAEVDKRRKLEDSKRQKDAIRQELLQQMEQKREQQRQVREQEISEYTRDKDQMGKWEEAEAIRNAALKNKVLQVAEERKEQARLAKETREREHRERQAEGAHIVKVARRELQAQQKQDQYVKDKKNKALIALVGEYAEVRRQRDAQKEERWQQERNSVQQYYELLEAEELRNKRRIVTPRGAEDALSPEHLPPPRRGADYYSEDNIARQLADVNRAKDAAAREKEESRRAARKVNQDFLAAQIEDQAKRRREATTHKGNQRAEVKAASDAHLEAERLRLAEHRRRNEAYRRDLERQMEARRTAPKDKNNEMSPAELAINRHIILDAQQLKSELLARGEAY